MILKFVLYVAFLAISLPFVADAAKAKQNITFSEHLMNVDCADHGEGAFVFGCSSEYFVCETYGQSYLKRMFLCPEGHNGRLKMNPLVNQCDVPKKIALCQEKADNKYASQIIRKEPFSCKDRKSGYYEVDFCSQEYAYCNSGYLNVLLCSSPYLYYNSTSGVCDYKTDCDRNSKPEASTEKSRRVRSTEEHASGDAQGKTEKAPRKIPNFSCQGKDDGHYSAGCSDVYFSCVGQYRYVRFCPENTTLKFSHESQRCDYAFNVTECDSSQKQINMVTLDKSETPDSVLQNESDESAVRLTTVRPMIEQEPTTVDIPSVEEVHVEDERKGVESSSQKPDVQ